MEAEACWPAELTARDFRPPTDPVAVSEVVVDLEARVEEKACKAMQSADSWRINRRDWSRAKIVPSDWSRAKGSRFHKNVNKRWVFEMTSLGENSRSREREEKKKEYTVSMNTVRIQMPSSNTYNIRYIHKIPYNMYNMA